MLRSIGPSAVSGETVPTHLATGRVLARRYLAPSGLPAFARSSMDGYSVRASDTFGASDTLPAYLEVVGEVPMGSGPTVSLADGEAAVAYTGGMLANGADAVVMVEHTHPTQGSTIEVVRPVAPGENVIQPLEDIADGAEILAAGRTLRPQDIGALLALGITEVEVAIRPTVAVVSTGDELVEPSATPDAGQIRDINTHTVGALAERAGAIPVPVGIFADDIEAQRAAAAAAMERGDIVVFSAGSSVGARDMTARVLAELGEPGVLVHGLAIKPGKPTIAGLARDKPVFGLPGNPVSAMVVFDLLVSPVIRALMGSSDPNCGPSLLATLSMDVPSVAGREDHFPVRLSDGPEGPVAEPIFGKSNLIFTLVRADGLACVPLDCGGLYAGDRVGVRIF